MNDAATLAHSLRAARSALVADVAAGRIRVADVGADDRSAPVKVVVIAEAVPGVGKVASRRLLDSLGIGHSRRWGELSPGDAARLVDGLATASGASPTAAP